jgi:DNA protecting protein DprA
MAMPAGKRSGQRQMRLPMTETEAREAYAKGHSGSDDRQGDPSPRRRNAVTTPGPAVVASKEEERSAGVSATALAALYALESVKFFGPGKFREIYDAELTFEDVVQDPTRLPTPGKRGADLRREIARVSGNMPVFEQRAHKQIWTAAKLGARIITYWDSLYPRQVLASNNPVPAIYLLGSTGVVSDPRAVACVGSRNIHEPYSTWHANFAKVAVELGITVASGFALGADTIGHRTAYEVGGRTICVMPSGLDRPFPPENRSFWKQLLDYKQAALVSEFPFGTSASALTLRKRNKLIVAVAMGVLMSQSSSKGGAMNAYRFALEMRRPFATFQADSTDDTSGNAEAVRDQKGDVTELNPGDRSAARTWLQQLSPST